MVEFIQPILSLFPQKMTMLLSVAYNLEAMQTRWKIELRILSKVLEFFASFCLYFLPRTSIPLVGCSFFRSQIAGIAQNPAKPEVQCTKLLKGNVISLGSWMRTLLETKDMRHWPFCKALMVVDAAKCFHDKLLQLVFSTAVWFRLERITINPVFSPVCSNQGQLRALSSRLFPPQFWEEERWGSCSLSGEPVMVFDHPTVEELMYNQNFLCCNLCLCISLSSFMFFCLSRSHKNKALLWYHLRGFLCSLHCFVRRVLS